MISPYAIPGIKKLPASSVLIGRIFKRNSMPFVMEIVIELYEVREKDIKSPWRKREIVWARQVFCYLCYKYLKCSLKDIGEFVGGRDHTTVIHSNQVVLNLMDSDPAVREEVEQIESEVINRRLKIVNT